MFTGDQRSDTTTSSTRKDQESMSHITIQPNHTHEHLEGDSPAPSGGPSVGKSVMIPPVTGLVIGILFVTVFLDAFHAPQPHNLPVGIVGAAQQVEAVEHALQKNARGRIAFTTYDSAAAAQDAIEH